MAVNDTNTCSEKYCTVVNSFSGDLLNKTKEIVNGKVKDNSELAEELIADINFYISTKADSAITDIKYHALEEEERVTKRIKEFEGTVSDLKTVPVVGSILIFMRGAFRPLFSYFILFAVYMVYTGGWKISGELENLFYTMVTIVLTFYFGERTLKNIIPLLSDFNKNKKKDGN